MEKRKFVGLELGIAPFPDETAICKFRHLFERHNLGKAIFSEINAHLQRSGVKIADSTIVGATIFDAPSLTITSRANSCMEKRCDYAYVEKPKPVAYRNRPLSEADRDTNRRKSGIRARVEHVFRTIKGRFSFRKVHYCGLKKKANEPYVLCTLANLVT